MNDLQIVNRTIAMVQSIPSNKWCSYIQQNRDGQRCFLGHFSSDHRMVALANCAYAIDPNSFVQVVEAQQVSNLYLTYLGDESQYQSVNTMITINNGADKRYQQATEKERVLASLYDIKRMILTQFPPVDEIIDSLVNKEPCLQEM